MSNKEDHKRRVDYTNEQIARQNEALRKNSLKANPKLQKAARELEKTFLNVTATVVGDEIHIRVATLEQLDQLVFSARVFAAHARMNAFSVASDNTIHLYDARK